MLRVAQKQISSMLRELVDRETTSMMPLFVDHLGRA